MLRWFISAGLIFITCIAFGQQADSLTLPTARNRFTPSGLRLGTDLITLIKSQAGNRFDGWEVNADVDFYRYYLTLDYGAWAKNLSLKNGNYQNDGNYWRLGVDVNFLLKDPDRNMFFMGIRYAGTTYNESLQYQYTDTNFGTVTQQLTNVDRTAQWSELVTGLRVKVWKELWMGYTGRLKFSLSQKGPKAFDSYDIPGYGTLAKDVYWGFNYQVFWRFAWKKNLGATRLEK